MENKNYDLKLAGYIWSILKTQPVIVMSWGVDMDTIKPVKGGLEFHVQGFKHTGMVVFSVKVFVPQFVAVKIADNQRVFVQIMSVGFQSFGGVYHVAVA